MHLLMSKLGAQTADLILAIQSFNAKMMGHETAGDEATFDLQPLQKEIDTMLMANDGNCKINLNSLRKTLKREVAETRKTIREYFERVEEDLGSRLTETGGEEGPSEEA